MQIKAIIYPGSNVRIQLFSYVQYKLQEFRDKFMTES